MENMDNKDPNRIEVYLDDDPEPLAVFRPPSRFSLDTTLLTDGNHFLTITAIDSYGRSGIRRIPFEVRNGPGIAVEGIKDNEILEGKVSLLINAYGGSYEEKWEPERAETPAPIPTWAWILFIFIVAWAIYYFAENWKPSERFATTPTYSYVDKDMTESITSTKFIKESSDLGAQLFRTSCASCHQVNGEGVTGVFPPLVSDPVVVSTEPERHIMIVLFGAQGTTINGVKYSTPMPAWAEQLSDEEIAAVINHERSSWGNNAPTVTPDDVSKARSMKK